MRRGYREVAQQGARLQDWGTPPALFAQLAAEFGFVLDAAASADNALCERYFTPDDDALAQSWAPGPVYCNPPFADADQWIVKAAAEAVRGVTSVLLVPVRTSNPEWHQHILNRPGVEIRFILGRVTFVGAQAGAPFAVAVVIFRPPTPKESEASDGGTDQI